MRILKTNPVLTIFNSYLVDSPQPSTLSYLWNFGSLLGLCLVVQIVTGILLAMHYQGSAEAAFHSLEHIMRDVNDGWLLRMSHANMASFFFMAVYLHISRGLYYGSYRSPRIGVWVIGTIIFFLMMATAFLGYVLPYGQMSLWGIQYYNNIIIYLYKVNLMKLHSRRLLINLTQRKFIKYYYSVSSNIKPDKKFMSLFIGFMDGVGYFDIGEQKQYNKITKTLVKSTLRIRLATYVNIRDLSNLRLFR